MSAETADPIEVDSRVVDRVEPPQERHLVTPAVDPVGDEVEQDDAEESADTDGRASTSGRRASPGSHTRLATLMTKPTAIPTGRGAAGQPVGDVGEDAGSAQPLAVPREQLLERNDEHEQHGYEQCRGDVEHEGDGDRCQRQTGPEQPGRRLRGMNRRYGTGVRLSSAGVLIGHSTDRRREMTWRSTLCNR